MPILRKYVPPAAQAPEVPSDVAEFNEAYREDRSNRRSQNSVPAAPEPSRQYRNLREALEDVGHNMPTESQLKVHPDALAAAVRTLAARGLTDESIQTEIGAASVATVRRLRAHLRCEGPSDDVPPEAA